MLLGLATVALHTRLQPGQAHLLSGTVTLRLRRPAGAIALGALAVLALGGWTWAWVCVARVRTAETALLAAPPAEAGTRAEVLLALHLDLAWVEASSPTAPAPWRSAATARRSTRAWRAWHTRCPS